MRKLFSRTKKQASQHSIIPERASTDTVDHPLPIKLASPSVPPSSFPRTTLTQESQRCRTTEAAKIALKHSLKVLAALLDGLPFPAKGCVGLASEIMKIVDHIQFNTVAIESFNTRCELLQNSIEGSLQGKDLANLSEELKHSINRLYLGVIKTFSDVTEFKSGTMGAVFRTEEDAALITRANSSLDHLLHQFWVENQIAGNIALHELLEHHSIGKAVLDDILQSMQNHVMNKNIQDLNVAPAAAYNSYDLKHTLYFKDTRVKLLSEIASWASHTETGQASIYVLDGVAGIGKSTVCKTVAVRAAEVNALGASFFFSRGEKTRGSAKSFFPTIACQLARYDEVFATKISAALEQHLDAKEQSLQSQFSTLIVNPLKELLAQPQGRPILVVVDALDECEEDGDTLLSLLADNIHHMRRLKVFITTRPEFHIRRTLSRYKHLDRFRLHDIEASVVQSDIRLYLSYFLSAVEVQKVLSHLTTPWEPTKDEMALLTAVCGTFFIVASTAVKFILDSRRANPKNQLNRLLNGVSLNNFADPKRTESMDEMYLRVLQSAVPDECADSDWIEGYQTVVGTIILLENPLPCHALSKLLGISIDDIQGNLLHLHSLVAPRGEDMTFRVHHKSFPDFVTSAERCQAKSLFIDTKVHHLRIGKRCLELMTGYLKTNIRDLGPDDWYKENSELPKEVRTQISDELAYSCTHWASHLHRAGSLEGVTQLVECFASKYLLAWLEVLSLIGQMDIACPSVDRIRKMAGRQKPGIVKFTEEILNDAYRFISMNFEILKLSSMHVYFSALPFTPSETLLFRTYSTPSLDLPQLRVVSGVEQYWNPSIAVMMGHTGAIRSIAFSADGSRLASASADGTVRLWDGQSGSHIFTLNGHSSAVQSVAFSPDGGRLASASSDQTVRLWDGHSHTVTLTGHSSGVQSVAFSPDSSRLASASNDQTVRLWDVQSGDHIATLEGHSGCVRLVAFTPDGSRLASAADDETVCLWDGQSGRHIFTLEGHSAGVTSLAFSADGSRLASGSRDHTVRLWDGHRGGHVSTLEGHSSRVRLVAFSPDGSRLASSSNDCTLRLWDGQSGTHIFTLGRHSDWVTSFAFSPDGSRIVSGSDDKTVCLWDSQLGHHFFTLKGHSGPVRSVAFSADGLRIASASDDRTIRLWDGLSGSHVSTPGGHFDWVTALAFSVDGSRLVSASADRTVWLWDARSGSPICTLLGNLGWVRLVEFSADGSKLVSACSNKTVHLWDGQSGSHIFTLEGHSSVVQSAAFSPDGSRLVSACADNTVCLWDVQSGRYISILEGHSGRVRSIIFSPDGSRLASGSEDQTVRLWDGHSGQHMSTLEGHSSVVQGVAFSPDGGRLASASSDKTVRVWVGQSGIHLSTLEGHSSGVQLVSFSPDGSKLISAADDKTVRLWDSFSGAALGVLFSGQALSMQIHSDYISLVVQKSQPALRGLVAIKFETTGAEAGPMTLCWFPPSLCPTSISVNMHSKLAVAAQPDGRLLFFDISALLI